MASIEKALVKSSLDLSNFTFEMLEHLKIVRPNPGETAEEAEKNLGFLKYRASALASRLNHTLQKYKHSEDMGKMQLQTVDLPTVVV